MAERQSGGKFPWPTVLMVVLAASGAMLYFSPLSSSRPAFSSAPSAEVLGIAGAPAHLWQDPFTAIVAHNSPRGVGSKPFSVKWHPLWTPFQVELDDMPPKPDHPIRELLSEIEKTHPKQLLILPVMVAGGPYAEVIENRLRARVAIIEALGVCGFQPLNTDQIQYVQLDWAQDEITPGPGAATRLASPKQTLRMVVPYEWFRRTAVTIPCDPSLRKPAEHERILVLWLREEMFRDVPLTRLAHLVQIFSKSNVPAEFKILGPRTSTALLQLVQESNKGVDDSVKHQLANVQMLSSTATADDELLLDEAGALKQHTIADLIECATRPNGNDGRGFRFIRTTLNDAQLSSTMADELERRGRIVVPDGKKDWDHVLTTDPNQHLALVYECDTVYGRTLPMSFTAAALGLKGSDVTRLVDPAHPFFPSWIHAFVYLRGLDGRIAGDEHSAEASDASKSTAAQQQTSKLAQPSEQPEGLNQSDYVRRLAQQLVDLNDSLTYAGKELTAVGILGTDVYDKLLVLKAIRDRLPNVTYFTLGVDARYSLPSELAGTHNLLITSPFGNRLHARYQGNVPPFRDSYQTALFAATLTALDVIDSKLFSEPEGSPCHYSEPPRIFEITRTGPWDLSIDKKYDWRLNADGPNAEARVLSSSTPRISEDDVPLPLNPPRYDLRSWSGGVSRLFPIGLLVLAVAITAWRAKVSGLSVELNVPDSFLLGLVLTLACLLFATFVVYAFRHFDAEASGEIFAWGSGNSIWVTEALRVFATLLCVLMLFRMKQITQNNDARMARDFKLPWPKKTPSPIWKLSGWQPSSNSVNAARLWTGFLARMTPVAQLKRVLPFALLYLIFGSALAMLLPMPGSPGRSAFSRGVDLFVISFLVVSFILLTFAILDATIVNSMLMCYLRDKKTVWPPRLLNEWKSAYGLEELDLRDYLDIEFIARRTTAISRFVYYPFVIFFLMIVSRASVFDNWGWPVGLVLLMLFNMFWVSAGALMMRREAEHVRRVAIDALQKRLVFHVSTKAAAGEAVKQLIEHVQNEQRGAFSVLSPYPRLAAVLIPTGGVGVWALVDYLGNLVR